MAAPRCVTVGSIFIDDLVFPDGRTQMGVLGGGGTHAAAGMLVWDEHPALIASIGDGLPADVLARLERDFITDGLVRLAIPQARAWQIFEWDGTRTEVFRMKVMQPFICQPLAEADPTRFPHAEAVHVLRDAVHFRGWRDRYPGAIMLWEPDQPYMVATNRDEFIATLPHTDIVSPNLLETRQLYDAPHADPVDLLRRLLADGAQMAVLRMGEAGSLAGHAASGRIVRLPAVPVTAVVDVTGAGNCYCGAFLLGWLRHHDLLPAMAHGAVSASFTVETVGALDNATIDAAERDRRYAAVLSQAQEIAL